VTKDFRRCAVPLCLGLLAALVVAGGCRSKPLSPIERVRLARQEAETLTGQAATLRHTDDEKAERLLLKAIRVDPACIAARNNLGALYLDRGDLYRAAVELELAVSLDSQRAAPHHNLALVFEQSGRYEAAAEELEAARRLDSGNTEIEKALARVWHRLGRSDEAMRSLVTKLRQTVHDPVWVAWLNETAESLGQPAP